MTLSLRFVSHSEVGLVRKNNQDSGYASPHLLAVADGMGGAAAGDLASAVAVDTLSRIEDDAAGEAMLTTMLRAVHTANDRIADLVEADTSLDGMGTTVTAALFDGAQLGLVHIGDSRAYLLRANALTRLTHDHSWVQSLVDEGKISEDEAASHPHRSLLLKVLNGQPSSEPDLTLVDVQAGDRLMFCSDGLCGLVDDVDILEMLRLDEQADALDALVAAARSAGGIDNITVVVADLVEPEPGPATEAADDRLDETPLDERTASPGVPAQPAVVFGAAAERRIPPVGLRAEAHEDTVVTARVRPGEAPAPAAPTPVVDDEARYAPQPPRRRRFLRPLVGLVVLLLVAGAGLGTAYAWTRTQYFVGVSGDNVAIFQGLSDGLPGLTLSTLYEQQPLTVASLPPYYQDKVRGNIDVPSLEAARETVTELTAAVQRCEQQNRQSPSPSPSPSTSTSASPTPSVSTSSSSAVPGGEVDC